MIHTRKQYQKYSKAGLKNMAKWGNCDFRQLKNLQKNMQKMVEQGDTIKFCEECARELAARLLAMVIKRTPVGDNQYEDVLDNSGNKVVYKKGKNKGKTKQQVEDFLRSLD